MQSLDTQDTCNGTEKTGAAKLTGRIFQPGNPAEESSLLHETYTSHIHTSHIIRCDKDFSLSEDAAYSITACADQARGALSIQKCPRQKKQGSLSDSTQLIFLFFRSHIFKKVSPAF